MSETLLESMGTWDTPALRHLSLGHFSMPLTGVLDRFLGRWAHQIESLFCREFDPSRLYSTSLPDFGLSFPCCVCSDWTAKLSSARNGPGGPSCHPPPTRVDTSCVVSTLVRGSVRSSVRWSVRSKTPARDGPCMMV